MLVVIPQICTCHTLYDQWKLFLALKLQKFVEIKLYAWSQIAACFLQKQSNLIKKQNYLKADDEFTCT